MKALAERVPVFLLTRLHSRYTGDRGKAYTDSYRAIRLMVGFLGVLLPIIFIIGEAFLIGSVHFRGSLSAYYHTAMQDVFVGGLCTIGLLLITYMAGEHKSPDFWASVIAGVALLGVVFFPTSRPGLPAPACGSVTQTPPGCSFVEQALGEHTTAVIHAVFAVVFIIFLAVMSFLFAISEVETPSDKKDGVSLIQQPKRRLAGRTLARIHGACTIIILVAGAWVFVGGALGANIWELTPLYVGEVVSVLAFGLSWLLAGFYMTASSRFGPVQAAHPPAEDAVLGQLCEVRSQEGLQELAGVALVVGRHLLW